MEKGTSALANLVLKRELLSAWLIVQKAQQTVAGWVAARSPTRGSTMRLYANQAKYSPELALLVSTNAPTTQVEAARSVSASAPKISTAALAFFVFPIICTALMSGIT